MSEADRILEQAKEVARPIFERGKELREVDPSADAGKSPAELRRELAAMRAEASKWAVLAANLTVQSIAHRHAAEEGAKRAEELAAALDAQAVQLAGARAVLAAEGIEVLGSEVVPPETDPDLN